MKNETIFEREVQSMMNSIKTLDDLAKDMKTELTDYELLDLFGPVRDLRDQICSLLGQHGQDF